MEWMPGLVETGIDGQPRSFDVMAIRRPDGLGEIANLGDRAREGGLTCAGCGCGETGVN
jgi:hypothetical protein